MENRHTPESRVPLGTRLGRRAALAVAGGTLLAVLGFNAVATLAADPSPSAGASDQGTEQATPAPNDTERGAKSHRGARGDCPEKNGGGGSQGGGGGQGQQPTPSDDPQQPTPSDEPQASSETPES